MPSPERAHPDPRSTHDKRPRARVLVLDGDMVPALAVARSLGRRGLHVDVASDDASPLAASSRWVRSTLRYPSPLAEEAAFVDWVAERAAATDYDLIVPVTERTLAALHRQRDRASPAALALPPARALDTVLDKSLTLALAADLGIRCPRGGTAGSVDAALDLAEQLRYPVVVKPVSSIASGTGTRRQLTVSYARDERELRTRAEDALRHGAVLIQELFLGEGVGIELIADHGRILYAFQHRRLHEVPLTGGGSSLRASVPVDPGLLSTASRLVEALGWHGVAMVELKRNPQTGESCLMEINGRFWGSLPLAIAAGADFPAMLYELLVEGAVRPRPAARTGIYCRNLARDLHWLELVLRREAPEGVARLPTWSQVLRDSLLAFSPRHRFDVQQLADSRPGLVDLGRVLASYRDRAAGLLAARRHLQRQRAAWRPKSMGRRLREARSLLFLCYGNINRSALAERLAQERLGPRFRLASAGFHPRVGRPADPVMVSTAAARGLDLSASRSKRVDAAAVARSDLIFAMETKHLERLLQLFPEAAEKTFLLGPAAPDAVPGGEIPDPYGQPRDLYERCCIQLERCVDALAELSEVRRSPRCAIGGRATPAVEVSAPAPGLDPP